MRGLYDEDGIDGSFERLMRTPIVLYVVTYEEHGIRWWLSRDDDRPAFHSSRSYARVYGSVADADAARERVRDSHPAAYRMAVVAKRGSEQDYGRQIGADL